MWRALNPTPTLLTYAFFNTRIYMTGAKGRFFHFTCSTADPQKKTCDFPNVGRKICQHTQLGNTFVRLSLFPPCLLGRPLLGSIKSGAH